MGTLSDRYRAGWRALTEGQLDVLLDIYTPDVEVKENGRTARGRQEVRALYQGWLDAFSDLRAEFLDVVEHDDTLAGEKRLTMTHSAPLVTPGGTVPATGRTVVVESCDIVHFRAGHVITFHSYFDQLSMMQQLGLLPAPDQAADSASEPDVARRTTGATSVP